jgi:hypothetical protein
VLLRYKGHFLLLTRKCVTVTFASANVMNPHLSRTWPFRRRTPVPRPPRTDLKQRVRQAWVRSLNNLSFDLSFHNVFTKSKPPVQMTIVNPSIE